MTTESLERKIDAVLSEDRSFKIPIAIGTYNMVAYAVGNGLLQLLIPTVGYVTRTKHDILKFWTPQEINDLYEHWAKHTV